jgi:phosphinothricin acetyltransferase
MASALLDQALIRSATEQDGSAIAGIYNHYILNTVVTFEERAVSPGEMSGRILKVLGDSLPYLVAVEDGLVVGYAYATGWHERSAYRYSVETTVYLEAQHLGKRIGSHLYSALLAQLVERGMHVAIGGIALPNERSVALHEKLAFRKVAHYPEVGFKFNRWIDVGYWQRLL